MTVTCPRCGLAFETRATTNTRCRRCKAVVRVGTSTRRTRLVSPPGNEGSDEGDAGGGGASLLVAGFVLLAGYGILAIVRGVRRRRAAARASSEEAGPASYQGAPVEAGASSRSAGNTAPSAMRVSTTAEARRPKSSP